MNPIDKFLNKITMYRLMVYTLSIYVCLAIVYAFMGRLAFSPTALVVSLGVILAAAYATDRGLGRLFHVPTNMESSLITSLIIFLIVQPAHTLAGGLALALAGAASSLAKFLLAWNGKHIFNPAAFAATLVSLIGLQATTWWVGSSNFWPVTLVLGLLVVRKIRRFPLFITFVVIAVLLQVVLYAHGHQALLSAAKHMLIASPLIFLSTLMLTEPATMPPRRNLQMAFGALVAVLYASAWRIGPLTIYPEIALLLGNVFAFAVSPKFRVRLTLTEVQKISDRVYSYVFRPEHRFTFLPGQYMDWTLARVPYDSRGNRRTFTIASSPTEPEVRLGIKYYEPASMYKAAFERLQPGDTIYAGQIAGNFTLSGNEGAKLAFVAGGIGITPFRSMVKYLADKGMQSDVLLLYVVADPQELAFMDDFQAAADIGVKTIPVVTNPALAGPGMIGASLSTDLLRQLVPDHAERTFYISGPNLMVDATKQYLHQLGVAKRHIKTDHFSGY
jgi:ferredoxin-NADP reductase